LQIIGEAARALPEHVRAQDPDIEWHEVIGMRNVLVHGYFEIDVDIVWETVISDLRELKPRVQLLLQRLETTE